MAMIPLLFFIADKSVKCDPKFQYKYEDAIYYLSSKSIWIYSKQIRKIQNAI